MSYIATHLPQPRQLLGGLPSQAHQPYEYAELPLLVESYEHMRRFLEQSKP